MKRKYGMMVRVSGVVAAVSLIPSLVVTADGTGEGAMQYGFRYDPMDYVEKSETLAAARVRRDVFGKPKKGDDKLIQAEIDKVMAKQQDSGHFDERGHIKHTCGQLVWLAQLGVDTSLPGIGRAQQLVVAEKCTEHSDNKGALSVRGVRGLIMTGMADHPQVKPSLENMIKRENVWQGPYRLCPWGTQLYLDALWAGRDIVDTSDVVKHTLTWMREEANAAGCVSYKDPICHFGVAGRIDTAEARQLVEHMLPMILRIQKPDGGWGGSSPDVFMALHRHGLLERLRELPPLPPDWKIVREIDVPVEKASSLAYDGERFWVLAKDENQAVALSADDGKELQRIDLPKGETSSIGWWQDGLTVLQGNPKRVLRLSGEGEITQQIDLKKQKWPAGVMPIGKGMWVYDAWYGGYYEIDPAAPDKSQYKKISGAGGTVAVSDKGFWHVPDFADLLLHTTTRNRLLDWGKLPFTAGCQGLAVADGTLWALDAESKRICMMKRLDMRQLLLDRLSRLVDEDGKQFRKSLETSHEAVAGALAAIAPELDLIQKIAGEEIHWYDDGGRLQTMFFVISDPRDLDVVLNSYKRTRDLDCPFTVNFVRQWTDAEGDWDIFVNHGECRIRHCNRFWGPNRKVVKREPELRQDLYTLFACGKAFPAPGNKGWFDLLSGPTQGAIDRLAEMAEEHDCVQTIENGIPAWRDPDGTLQVMFEILPDHTDLDNAIGIYERIKETKCPITFQITKEWPDVFDVMRFSSRSYIEHHNQAKRNGGR